MGRSWSFACFLVIAALSVTAPAARAASPFDSVQIKTHRVAGNIYMLEGSGGNIGVSVGEDGILMIDDQFAPLSNKIKAALARLGPGKPKFLLNTHWHPDHTSGNPVFGKDTPIISHKNVRKRLEEGVRRRNTYNKPLPKEGLPVITFDESLSIHFNGEEIRAIHFPTGHTDGDTIVFFPKSKVVHMGDHMFSGLFPFIDLVTGGDVEGYTKNVKAVLDRIPPETKVIPGHGPLSGVKELKVFYGMLVETTDFIRGKIRAGKGLDAIKAEGLPARWKGWAWQFVSEEKWIATVYMSLQRKK
ncbi:MAG: MBL fold metallo-hydrolase [bacterium]|nr:MBL fold metallo-hydrolase [bacterium]